MSTRERATTVRVYDSTHEKLDEARDEGETFDETLNRILDG
jgi:hypothetical protein